MFSLNVRNRQWEVSKCFLVIKTKMGCFVQGMLYPVVWGSSIFKTIPDAPGGEYLPSNFPVFMWPFYT